MAPRHYGKTVLRWGHIMRMPEENPVKKLTLLRSEGSRRAGRPKLCKMVEWSGGGPQDPWY